MIRNLTTINSQKADVQHYAGRVGVAALVFGLSTIIPATPATASDGCQRYHKGERGHRYVADPNYTRDYELVDAEWSPDLTLKIYELTPCNSERKRGMMCRGRRLIEYRTVGGKHASDLDAVSFRPGVYETRYRGREITPQLREQFQEALDEFERLWDAAESECFDSYRAPTTPSQDIPSARTSSTNSSLDGLIESEHEIWDSGVYVPEAHNAANRKGLLQFKKARVEQRSDRSLQKIELVYAIGQKIRLSCGSNVPGVQLVCGDGWYRTLEEYGIVTFHADANGSLQNTEVTGFEGGSTFPDLSRQEFAKMYEDLLAEIDER